MSILFRAFRGVYPCNFYSAIRRNTALQFYDKFIIVSGFGLRTSGSFCKQSAQPVSSKRVLFFRGVRFNFFGEINGIDGIDGIDRRFARK